jgi:short-subunit dehydrogenase
MARSLNGKAIVITGASSGIGRATAIHCAKAGMDVALFARRADKLEETAQAVRDAGTRAVTVVGDVTVPDDQQRLFDEADALFGRIDVVFANAGYGVEAPISRMSVDAMRDLFETNFFGTLHTIEAGLPALRRAEQGHLLLCSSCVGRIPLPAYGGYSATKAAQHHIGRAMRLELEPEGIYVTTVHPVGTRTEFFDTAEERTRATGQAAGLTAHTPDWAMQPVDRVARAVVRCLRRPRPEIWMSRTVLLGAAVTTLFPRVWDLSLRGIARKAMQHPD